MEMPGDRRIDASADGTTTAGATPPEAARVVERSTPPETRSPGADPVVELDGLLGAAGHGALRVPVGRSADLPVFLDLKQAAEGGDGPHGLIVGATGSGKSELLRTIIAALAVTHPPSAVTFLIIDYLGEAAFEPFDRLPHTAGTAIGLGGGPHDAVDHLQRSVRDELQRRRERLRRARVGSRTEYERARTAGAPIPPMPALLIVWDELPEMLTARPDVADLLRLIGRIGRATGVHLLLAARRLEEDRLRGLEGHLSYRICLRTSSRTESTLMIGVPDAAGLPRAPGHALLRRSGGSPPERFRAAFVSGPRSPARTLLDQLIDALANSAEPTRRLWPPTTSD